MAPTATASARRAPAPSPRPASPRRPALRLFEPARRRPTAARSGRRPAIWASGLVVVGSLLAVVVGDALLAQGQVRLSSLQAQVSAATAAQKSLQVSVAQKTAPPVVVGQAESQGMVAPTQVVYLPRVPLDVPLPTPRTTPPPASTTPSGPSRPATPAAPASTPASSNTATASAGR